MNVMSNGERREWHALSPEEVLKLLKTSLDTGLSTSEARRRLSTYGLNVIEEKRVSPIKMFVRQFTNFLIVILIIASIVALFLGEFIDAIVILAIVALMGVTGFIQEYRAERTVEKLKELASPTARVLRDGKVITVPAKEVVPGDVIVLREGDRVPADARVVKSEGLEVDESSLTGESLPIHKVPDPLPPNTPPLDRRNMVYMGTYVVRGRGLACVVATGMKTFLGRVAKQVQEVEEERTLLERELDRFGRRVGAILVGICAMVFIVSVLIRAEPIIDSLLLAIALAVAAVPEGLPAIATMVLALGAWRMAKRNALVKRLAAIETLGACNVIASDKTGTITKGEMTVKKVWVFNELIEVSGVGYEPRGTVRYSRRSEGIIKLLAKLIAAHTSIDASIELINGRWVAKGSPTEASALVFSYKVLGKEGVEGAIKELEVVKTIPFDRFRKRKTTLHKLPSGKYVAVSSGAPESVLSISDYLVTQGGAEALSSELRSKVLEVVESLAREGYRTYAVAYREVSSADEELEQSMYFLAIFAILDPPREGVREAIEEARRAGVKVIMVTGDHKLTATTVAKLVGLDVDNGLVLEGRDLDELSDEELKEIIDKVVVFARVTPEHKARIVKALKRRGYVVAMTGDGVNDAPALKLADIGVAMGIRGTDVAKEAAQLILLDDNFSTIVEAIKEGRVIYENLKKPINYLLTCNLGEVALIFGSEMLNLPPALTAIQLLWINVTTDALPALALGVEPPEPGIMEKPPRGRESTLITNRKVAYYVGMGALLGAVTIALYKSMLPLGLRFARTVAFTAIALSEFGRALASRSEELPIWKLRRNKWLPPALLASATLQLMVLYTPPLTTIFKTYPLPPQTYAYIAIAPIAIYVADEIRKLLRIKIT